MENPAISAVKIDEPVCELETDKATADVPAPATGVLRHGAIEGDTVLVGAVIATWLTGKFAKMNTAAVFVGLLFWAWLWGVWGMLLGIPIIVIVKVVSQHVEQLHPVAELLASERGFAFANQSAQATRATGN